ncbi:TetR/AcrR family transcriptional regulator [Phenylobacterium sp. LH3H17]|uniref:TetR family transcriptional regulator n=1 Tax=Phenylobacterium sp. LH3H17 TaxID=2903901 RepID=UPI0020C99B9D|nr:TetR family transcriptional regulator [Phenylobacterium sp. LH3H17]UTP38283.1 TetR/AcrR family transcriptional regulator [Phenylobacterium sp. LH3H17]
MPQPSWKSSPKSRDEQHELKRNVLLREAALAFNKHGFHGTSLDDVAGKLGLTKATLYYYFPNKQALLRACFDRAIEAAFKSLSAAQRTDLDARSKLRLALRGYLEEMIDELSCCVVLTEESALLPEDRDVIVGKRDQYENELRALVRTGIEDGSIANCDPKLAVFVILGAINWVPRWFQYGGAWDSRQLAEAMSQLLERALSSKPSKSLAPDVSKIVL